MARLEDLTRGASIKGILPDRLVAVVDVKWLGSSAVELTYKDAAGRLGSELLYRDREASLEIAVGEQPWSFDSDGALFRLVSEAHRIRRYLRRRKIRAVIPRARTNGGGPASTRRSTGGATWSSGVWAG